MFNFKSNKGFTLLELMVVIGVLAILMLAAVPYFLGAQQDAEASNALRDAKTLEDTAMQEYVSPSTQEWTDGIAEEGEAEGIEWDTEELGLEGMKELDPVLMNSVQRLYNELEDYFIVTDGKYEGYVFLKESVRNSDGTEYVHPDYNIEVGNGDSGDNGEMVPEWTPVDYFDWYVEEGDVVINGYDPEGGDEGEILEPIIPDEIEGNKVAEIANHSLNEVGLEGVEFSDNVERIGENAFDDNDIEGHLKLPDNEKLYAGNAFTNNDIQEVTVPDNASLHQTFEDGGNFIETVHIGENVSLGTTTYPFVFGVYDGESAAGPFSIMSTTRAPFHEAYDVHGAGTYEFCTADEEWQYQEE